MTFGTVVITDLVGIRKLPQIMTLTYPIIGAFRLIVISTSGRLNCSYSFLALTLVGLNKCHAVGFLEYNKLNTQYS